MFNPRYTQLLQQKGLANHSLGSTLIPTANPIARTLGSGQVQQQPALRPTGFGGNFKDSPPEFLTSKKVDNKIERTKLPKPKKKKKVKKN